MPATVYENERYSHATLGQSWRDEDIRDNIELCRDQPLERFFAAYLRKGARILDAGCGMGRWVFYLRDKGYAITGIDASAEAVRAAHLYDPEAAIRFGDVCSTGFPASSFDAILSLGVMEHFVEGPQMVLRESKRLLAEGGLLFVTIPPVNIVRRLLVHPLLACKKKVRELAGQKFVFSEYRFTVAEFAEHLRNAGFTVLETATDELLLPKNMGLYVDFPCLRHRERKWTLNRTGLSVARTLNLFSERIYRGGVLFVCRTASGQFPEDGSSREGRFS